MIMDMVMDMKQEIVMQEMDMIKNSIGISMMVRNSRT